MAPLAAAAPPAGDGGKGDPGGTGPPNVLVLVADDLGVEILASYGAQPGQPPTPVLDQLALDGVRFASAWAAPICTPSRAALQTGRYALRTGMGSLVGGIKDLDLGPYGLPLAEVTLPELLSLGAPGVWSTACIGKWHLGSVDVGAELAPNVAGYDHFAGTLGNFQNPESYTSWERVVDGVAANETAYATSVQVDDALAWIAQADGPWLCVVNFTAPHLPFHEPPAGLHTRDLSGAGPPALDPRPYYEAMVEAMDTEIGRLLAGLGSAAADTTVIFLADNGTPSKAASAPLDGQHAKGSFFEGGVHVPLIVRGPQVAVPGAVCDALVDVTDVWATVADVAAIDPAAVLAPTVKLDGVSLLPYLAQPDLASQKPFVFTEMFRPNATAGGLPVSFGTGPLCQQDLGFGGPGTAVMSACGDVLGGEGSVDVAVAGAPAAAPLFLAGSFYANPVPVLGGFLVPYPETTIYALATDVNGGMHLPGLRSSLGPFTFTFQAAIVDPAQPYGFAITNAVQLKVEADNTKAVRDGRYKLVRRYNGIGPDRMYDLWTDPYEKAELLSPGGPGALGTEESAAYASLSAALDALLASF
jgi:arylsulfatase A-like enzyme